MILQTSGENYLKAILMIQKEKGHVRSIDVAQYLSYSKPSVCCAVKKLEKDGYLTIDQGHAIRLTQKGRETAEKIAEKYYFFNEMLLNAGASQDVARQDACKMEHTISDEAFLQLKKSRKGMKSDESQQI